jgi:tetratricopeptide (TPR) repeat protein
MQGRPKDAERAFSDVLTYSRKRHLPSFEPRATARIAHLALARHEDDHGQARLEEALKQFRATHTLRSVEGCDALLAYGEILSRQGRTARAQRVLEEVAQVAQRQDLPLTLGRAQVAVARIHLAAGRTAQAVAALRSARDGLAAAGDSLDQAALLHGLGKLLADAGELQDAHEILQRALQAQERLGATRGRAATLDDLARVLVRMGKVADGQREAKAGLALAEELHDTVQKARSLVTLAQVARAQRRWKPAIDQFKEAVELFRRAKLPAELAEAARELGMLLKERGEHAQAADYLAMAISTEAETRKRAPGGPR